MCDNNLFVPPQTKKTVQIKTGIYSFTVWDAEKDTIEDYFEMAITEDTEINIGCAFATSGPAPWLAMQ